MKRGYYKFEIAPLHDFKEKLQPGQITSTFAKNLESSIEKNPENYLWSHKRWKRHWKDEYRELWVDEKEPPPAAAV